MLDYKKLKDYHKRQIYLNFKKSDFYVYRNKFHYFTYLTYEEGLPFNLGWYYRHLDKMHFYYRGDKKKKNINYVITTQFNNEQQRLRRCRVKIESYLKYYEFLYFATFTIDSHHYYKYVDDYSKFIRYIKDYCKQIDVDSFVFNLDWGSKNGRLHAHGLLAFQNKQDFKVLQESYKIGNIDLINCYNSEAYAITRYINKLSNHAFKDTTYCKCIYSRKKRKKLI